MPWRLVNDSLSNNSNTRLLTIDADFTANNVLQRVVGLDGLSERDLLEVIGNPTTTPLVTGSDEPHQLPTAPEYVVYPIRWEEVDPSHFSNETCVVDLGEAFKVNNPPSDIGIPQPYRSPELLLEKSGPTIVGFGCDLWALGCTLFEIRTGRKLFNLFDDDDDSYLDAMVSILGRMPEPWWSTTWEARKRIWRDEPDELGHAVPVKEHSMQVGDLSSPTYKSTTHPSVAEGARSLGDMLAPGVWYMDTAKRQEDTHRDIAHHEKVLFADLLSLFLKWQPQERIRAKEALNHDWFHADKV